MDTLIHGKEQKENKKISEIKNMWYYNIYIHKLKLSKNYYD